MSSPEPPSSNDPFARPPAASTGGPVPEFTIADPTTVDLPMSAIPVAPELFDQKAEKEPAPKSRRNAVLGFIVVAAIVGGGVGFVLSQRNDSASSDTLPAPDSTVSITTTVDAETSTTIVNTESTVQPTTIQPTTIPAETVPPVPTNPQGIPIGQPVNPASVIPEELYMASLGSTTDHAAGSALAFSRWFMVMRDVPPSIVASTNGFIMTAATGDRAEFASFEVVDGNVSNVTFCTLLGESGQGDCRATGELLTLSPTNDIVGQTAVIALTKFGLFNKSAEKTDHILGYTSAKPLLAVTGLNVDQVTVDSSTMVVTATSGQPSADIQVTYADGSIETFTFGLT